MAQTHYTAFTVQAAQVPSTLTAFPVLIAGSDARFKSVANSGHVFRSDGGDFRAYADSTLLTTYNYELVTYDETAGTFEMWVQVTILTGALDTPIYIGYGDTALTDASTSATWDSNYTGVWHLKNGTTLTVTDSSQSARNGTNDGATATAGKIDGGAAFVTGSSQSIIIPNADSLGNLTTYTLTGWFKTSNTADSGNFYAEGNSGANNPIVRVVINDAGAGKVSNLHRDDSLTGATVTSASNYSDNAWHHFALIRRAAASCELFVDNTSVGTDVSNSPSTTTTDKQRLGALERASIIQYYTGSLDEIHRSKIVRSADWLTTEYNNQSAPGTFYSVGSEVPVAGGQVTHNARAFPLGLNLGMKRRISG